MKVAVHGKHAVCEIWNADPILLDDAGYMRNLAREAAAEARAAIRTEAWEKFHPRGLSVVLVLAESHLSIHTYPEYGYAAVDCFTCGRHCDPLAACTYLVERLGDGCWASVLYTDRPASELRAPLFLKIRKGSTHVQEVGYAPYVGPPHGILER